MLAVFDFLWLASLMNKTCRLLSFLILSHSAIASQCFLLFLSTLPLPKKYMFYQNQCDQKFFPNICKSCPKMISLEKGYIFTHLQKLPKESGRFVQINCCLRLKKLAKVQKNRPIWSHWSELGFAFVPSFEEYWKLFLSLVTSVLHRILSCEFKFLLTAYHL